ncbi:protein GLUTAMINE DUMPER 5 [Carica papaya]|uniref:protein GLUTAMINE DUMPER 5 n=1 Tax=Carica papaya TaxID=3649 RepID=UPI000B8CA826|nr:protein GLUTAMINE DUMPER 5 [Carica papaya]
MRTLSVSYKSAAAEATMAAKAAFSPEANPQEKSPWHSPVPYLFGGLAAMLGLIAFALLILACSYWRLSSRSDNSNAEGQDIDSEGEKQGECCDKAMDKVYEEKILVIMAGNEKPTFLATPVSSKASSFADKDGKMEKNEAEKMENGEKPKEVIGYNQNQQMPTQEENRQTQQQHNL